VRVLVTGDAGLIGRDIAAALRDRGDSVVGYDTSRGEDVLDAERVAAAARGCDVVVHCAAIKNDSRGTPAEIFATNVTGTWNVLRAAEDAGIARFVYFSSAQVFGVFDPEAEPAYLPIDDRHPRAASRPYGLSKRFCEDLCASFTRRTNMTTVALRPVAVFDAATYDAVWRDRAALASRRVVDRSFVDVRDVTSAVLLALECGRGTSEVLTLCADDLLGPPPEHGDGRAFDTRAADELLGWRPAYSWTRLVEQLGRDAPGAAR